MSLSTLSDGGGLATVAAADQSSAEVAGEHGAAEGGRGGEGDDEGVVDEGVALAVGAADGDDVEADAEGAGLEGGGDGAEGVAGLEVEGHVEVVGRGVEALGGAAGAGIG